MRIFKDISRLQVARLHISVKLESYRNGNAAEQKERASEVTCLLVSLGIGKKARLPCEHVRVVTERLVLAN